MTTWGTSVKSVGKIHAPALNERASAKAGDGPMTIEDPAVLACGCPDSTRLSPSDPAGAVSSPKGPTEVRRMVSAV